MKSIPNLQGYKVNLIQIFNNTKDIEILCKHLSLFFTEVIKFHSYMRLPIFNIVPTKSLQYSVWYQDPNAITETLNIYQRPCDLYLWLCLDNKWYLDDLYDDINEVTERILKSIPAFHSIPENPKEVKALLESGLMDFKPKKFPKFSKKMPNDLNEVLTWDDRFLLVGTNIENLKIYSWKEWDELIERENFYMK